MKKRKNEILIYPLVLIVSFLLCYLIIDSLLYSLIYSILLLFLTFDLLKQYNKDKQLFENINKAYNFVCYFNVEMIANESVYESYKMIENYIDVDFANIPVEDLINQFNEISSNYNQLSFNLYIKQIEIYDTNGGDFAELEEIPTSLVKKNKIYYDKLKKEKESKLYEILTLYILFILIIIFLKISLSNYYSIMLNNPIYQILYFACLILSAISLYTILKQFFNNAIRGL